MNFLFSHHRLNIAVYLILIAILTDFNVNGLSNDTTVATSATDTEVSDMLMSKRTVSSTTILSRPQTAPPVFPDQDYDNTVKFSDNAAIRRNLTDHLPITHPDVDKSAVELIENNVSLTEDDKFDKLRSENSSPRQTTHLIQGQLAGILVGTIVVTSVAVYVGLVMYRKYLEGKYGNREMLVNDDDFSATFNNHRSRQTTDDLRFFSI